MSWFSKKKPVPTESEITCGKTGVRVTTHLHMDDVWKIRFKVTADDSIAIDPAREAEARTIAKALIETLRAEQSKHHFAMRVELSDQTVYVSNKPPTHAINIYQISGDASMHDVELLITPLTDKSNPITDKRKQQFIALVTESLADIDRRLKSGELRPGEPRPFLPPGVAPRAEDSDGTRIDGRWRGQLERPSPVDPTLAARQAYERLQSEVAAKLRVARAKERLTTDDHLDALATEIVKALRPDLAKLARGGDEGRGGR